MVEIIIGILFMTIVLSALGLLYFYNKITNKRIAVENVIESIYLQYKRKNDLITEYEGLIVSKGIQEQEMFNELIKEQYSFTNARTIAEVVKFSPEVNDDLGKLLRKKGPQQWDGDKEFKDLLYKLDCINEKVNELYQVYDHGAINYNAWLLKFPNNVLGGILGIRPLPYFLK